MVQPLGVYLDDLQEFQTYMLQAQNANAVLLAISQLGLLDHLDEGPASAADIAERDGLNCGNVFRVLRFLAAQQVIDCDEQDRFRHTKRSRLLQSYQSGLRFMREAMAAAPGLAECLKTGRPAFECSLGMPVFRYLASHPDAVSYFADLMSQTTAMLIDFIFANHRFQPFELAIDVGGSHGRLMMALLEHYADAHGIVFDLPKTAEQASAIIAQSPVADRIEARGGDFFQAVPAGGDLYLLKQILHDWGDEDCVKLLRSIRSAIADRGRLAVIEFLLPDVSVHHPGFAMDIHMMVLSTGRERTLSEYVTLLALAGFSLESVTANPQGQSVAEFVPV